MRLPLGSLSWTDPDYAGEDSYADAEPPLAEAGAGARAMVVDAKETPARTALVIEARDGFVHVFLPPLEKLETFAELVGVVDRAATADRQRRIILEGYGPPPDPRIKTLLVTPDPGVIEVNAHPTSSWNELSHLTHTLYAIARSHRLGTETFGLDGRHSGTGGGNHLTLGGAEPSRSPLLRRPDLLVSMLTYWQHHPALSYLFSGPVRRPDQPGAAGGRGPSRDPATSWRSRSPRSPSCPTATHRPWAVDRALRHLLTDITGNTHRAEFCVDKLYSPDSMRGRLGLLELRGFEMPPHPDMALVQALLVRALLAPVRRGALLGTAGPLGDRTARAVPAAALRDGRPGRGGGGSAGPRPRDRPGLVRARTWSSGSRGSAASRWARSSSSCARRSSRGTCSARSPPAAGRPATSTPRPSGCRWRSPASARPGTC